MGSPPTAMGRERRADRRVWLGGTVIVGIALYVALDAILQALPPHYSPISQAESDLGVGPYGWLMSVNFVVRGLVALALVAGIQVAWPRSASMRLGQGLLLVWAVGDVLLAIFATDVPPGRPTAHGAVHLVVAAVIFLAVTLGELTLALAAGRDPRWAPLRPVLLAIAALALLTLVMLTAGPGRAQYFGLIERVFIGLALLWMLVVGVWLTRIA